MQIATSPKSFFIFDLDDTLVNEFDYLASAYRHISVYVSPSSANTLAEMMIDKYRNGENVFAWLVAQFSSAIRPLDLNTLLDMYRNHLPQLSLRPGVQRFLDSAKSMNIPLGLITDGRSVTQRNKMKAAGINGYFDDVIISEEFGSAKPNPANFLYFEENYPGCEFWYFGDNTNKDFLVPATLGWKRVCIQDCGNNIHKQQLDTLTGVEIISSFDDIHLVNEKLYQF